MRYDLPSHANPSHTRRPTTHPAPSPRGGRDAGARSEHHGQARGLGAGAPQPSLDAVRQN